MQVGESVVNAIVEYHAQGSEEAHAEENRMFLRSARVNGNTACGG